MARQHTGNEISAPRPSPFEAPPKRSYIDGDITAEELRLANRNSGLPLEALRYDITPTGLHYLLIHFDIPFASEADWRLQVVGEVVNEVTLTLADIKALPAVTMTVTLECAGNGRAGLRPRPASMPWLDQAVGTSRWTGTPLRHILERAQVKNGAHEVAFFGADRGFDAGLEHDYARSLTADSALNGDVLVCYAMNDAPLLPQHGFPLRLVVPGWYGMASVKWLNRIEVLDRPFLGHQQTGTYMYRIDTEDPGVPVDLMRVRSLMIPPGIPDWYTRRRLVEAGEVELRGRAWSGGGVPVLKVEVATNGEWAAAELDERQHRYAWVGWRFVWRAAPGEYELMCRATDANGNVQPLTPQWDHAGFGNNAIQRVPVTVR
jgi:DMSO/TMAO reductase YedYZ molybdopterin-dependent catalytic subunit